MLGAKGRQRLVHGLHQAVASLKQVVPPLVGIDDARDDVGAQPALRVHERDHVHLAGVPQVQQVADHGGGPQVHGGAVGIGRSRRGRGRRLSQAVGFREDAQPLIGDGHREGDAAVVCEGGLAGQAPALGDGVVAQQQLILGARSGSAAQEPDAAGAAGRATAALRLQGETGQAHGLHHGLPPVHLDLGAEVLEGDSDSVSMTLV